jgi:hypothetical protein
MQSDDAFGYVLSGNYLKIKLGGWLWVHCVSCVVWQQADLAVIGLFGNGQPGSVGPDYHASLRVCLYSSL